MESGLESKASAEKTVLVMESMFDVLPLAYKRLVTFADWLMVIGGLKGATDISMVGDTWNEDEFANLKTQLELHGVKVSQVNTMTLKSGDLRRTAMIYNPETIKKETQNSKLTPPYDGQESLDLYLQNAKNRGYKLEAVYGKIYSFPESAILDFLAESDHSTSFFALLTKKRGKRMTLDTGNETYVYTSPPGNDITKRENAKRAFFSNLESSPNFQTIINSKQLKESDQEWKKRLPASIRGNRS